MFIRDGYCWLLSGFRIGDRVGDKSWQVDDDDVDDNDDSCV